MKKLRGNFEIRRCLRKRASLLPDRIASKAMPSATTISKSLGKQIPTDRDTPTGIHQSQVDSVDNLIDVNWGLCEVEDISAFTGMSQRSIHRKIEDDPNFTKKWNKHRWTVSDSSFPHTMGRPREEPYRSMFDNCVKKYGISEPWDFEWENVCRDCGAELENGEYLLCGECAKRHQKNWTDPTGGP